MSTVNVLFRVRSGKREEFLQTIKAIQNNLKAEAGLSKSSLFEDMEDRSIFYLNQDWATQDAMEGYIRSERFSLLMGVLKVLCTESEIRYQLTAGKQGPKIAEV